MTKRILAIGLIFAATSVGWLGLAALIEYRTLESRRQLTRQVASLWGEEHRASAPEITYESKGAQQSAAPESSNIRVALTLDQRKKGLLWHNTYNVSFWGDYTFKNDTGQQREFLITFSFPTTRANYDNFVFRVAGQDARLDGSGQDQVSIKIQLEAGQEIPVTIGYDSRGLDRWVYSHGRGISQVRNFRLVMTTDFAAVDFPPGTVSPASMTPIPGGWELVWRYDRLISGFQLGMEMPSRIQPGPLAGQITMFAPVSLLFFFFVIFVLSVLKDVKLHPMNYFFLAAAFFAFHLLFAYLVDHVDVAWAFGAASVTSVALVVSYLRLVVGPRFALVEAGLTQFIYLVLFSLAHFFQGFTGLTVTLGAIVTLAVMMQLTARIDWEERFGR
ncbi:MAG: inner membrane CreD family protein [Bacillota bacterium]